MVMEGDSGEFAAKKCVEVVDRGVLGSLSKVTRPQLDSRGRHADTRAERIDVSAEAAHLHGVKGG
jgi:hypothetical protein